MTKRKTELPSVRSEREAKEKADARAKQNEEIDRFKRDLAMTFKSPHGLRVLKWLHDECGFGQPILGANALGDIDKDRTVYGAMRLNLYVKLRKLLPWSIITEVEKND